MAANKSQCFNLALGGFLTGITLASLFNFDWPLAIFLALLGGVFLLLFLFNREWRLCLALGLIFFSFSFGAGRMMLAGAPDQNYAARLGQAITFSGIVTAEPTVGEKTTQLVLKPADSGNKILLLVPRYPEFHYGDQLIATGKLARPENFATQSGKIFDYQNYLAEDEIYYEIFQPKIKLLASQNSLAGMLYALKHKFLNVFAGDLPEPQAALLGGITIGAKQGLDSGTTDLFRTVGLSHVIVLSGYNITIVAESVMKLLAGLPFALGAGLGAASIILFVIMTGATSTAIRAALMALIALSGKWLGREYDSLRALFLAGVLMLIVNPKLLVFDISFQLSFLATLGVIIGPPRLLPYLTRVPERFALRDTLATTLSAQILVLPWILYQMGQLSLVALPVNLLILPIVPFTMAAGFFLGLIGLASPVLAWPLAIFSYLPLQYLLLVSRLFAAIPYASLLFANFPFWLTVIIYFLIWLWYRRSGFLAPAVSLTQEVRA